MRRSRDQIDDVVVVDRAHTLDAFASAVLSLEVVGIHALDISLVRHGYNNVLISDEILILQLRVVIYYLGSPVVAVF